MVRHKLHRKLFIHLGGKSLEYIKYDESSLLQALVFFIDKQLKNIKRKDIIPVTIDLEECLNYKDYDSNGSFAIFDNDYLLIHVSTKNIKDSVDRGFIFESPVKSLMCVILHELYHYLHFLETYNKSSRKLTPEQFQDLEFSKMNKKTQKMSHNEVHDFYFNNAEEISADEFAYNNLSYLENLYYTRSCLRGI